MCSGPKILQLVAFQNLSPRQMTAALIKKIGLIVFILLFFTIRSFINRAKSLKRKSYEGLSCSVYGD